MLVIKIYAKSMNAVVHGTRESIPIWNEPKEVACRTVAVFFYTRYVGLDIASNAQGPVIIEVNNKMITSISPSLKSPRTLCPMVDRDA